MVLIPSFLNSATSRVHPAESAIGSLFAEEPPWGNCQWWKMQVDDVKLTWLVVDSADVETALGCEEG